MLFGAHVSIAGGIFNAPENAAKIGCEVFQMFSRPPQGGKPKPLTKEMAQKFKQAMKKHTQEQAYIHAPYFINLASGSSRIRHSSVSILRDELERGTTLDCKAMMFHPGSAKDTGQRQGSKFVTEGLNRIMDGYLGTCQLLIEISAGAGMIMGDTFEEIANFIHNCERKDEIGVCFDTQHAFASGYDLRTKEVIEKVFDQFDKIIGLNKLILIHCNDSKVEFNTHKDRHEHLGEGYIGKSAFKTLVNHKKLKNIDLILETEPSGVAKDLALLKKIKIV
ncbi:deoxyribonuclease IV [Patescibacteria group bacterium]